MSGSSRKASVFVLIGFLTPMIRVSCEFHVPLGRTENTHYIREVAISVLGRDQSGTDFVLGKIGCAILLLRDAKLDGVNVFDICEQDSEGMYQVYLALFEENGEFQQELGIDDVTNQVLFLWRAVFHPKLRSYQDAILQVVCEMFGQDSVAILWNSITELGDRDLAELGFRKIGGTNLLFRHAAMRSRFAEKHPRGVDTSSELIASQSDQDWVVRKWDPYRRHGDW
jgi:hypothetical protein